MRYVKVNHLQVVAELYEFVNAKALPGSEVTAERFWSGFEALVHDQSPRNRELLADRLADLLVIPAEPHPDWSPEEIRQELDNNAQGILDYVVR
ncbi:Malate synthase [Paenibacillus sp. UNC496MF]|nr:hypothetical protein [Paenibacillus sp. UNC496MF]SFJ34441.1 Malate synthase [Paenibacillus sp. UNC496MF]